MANVHVEFTDAEDKIKIEGPPEEVEKVQTELQNMVTDLIDKLTFTELNVDPKFYKHIIGKNGTNGKLKPKFKLFRHSNRFFDCISVNRLNEETGVVINISENDGKNLIRIEGNHVGVEKAKKVFSAISCDFGILFHKKLPKPPEIDLK